MKRAVLLTLTALLILSSVTACGSKKNSDENKGQEYSRVLYADDESSSPEDAADESREGDAEEPKSDENGDSEKKDGDQKDKEKSDSSNDSDSKKKGNTSTYTIGPNQKTSSTSSKSTSSKSSSSSSKAATFIVESSGSSSSASTSSDAASTDTENSSAETDTWFDPNSEIETDNEIETDTMTENEPLGSFEEDDLRAPFNGGYIDLEDEFDLLGGILGNYNDVSENENPQNPDEIIKTYFYDGITVYTFASGDGEKEYVYKFEITDWYYETAKGVSLGMTEDEVKAAYGEFENGTTYTFGDKSVTFEFSGGIVTEIVYEWNR